MPNIKSAKKRVVSSKEAREVNRAKKATLRTAVKNAQSSLAADKDTARAQLGIAAKKLDQAAAAGLIHKNTAARRKSRLAKKVNTLSEGKKKSKA